MPIARSASAAACLLVLAACARDRARPARPPPPPPCIPDGLYHAQAQRTHSSGSVCHLNEIALVQGEVSIRRTAFDRVRVEHRGKYAHDAALDPYACVISTPRSPTYGSSILGTKLRGWAAYRVSLRPDGALAGTAQLDVHSNNAFVPACRADFQLWGRRIR